MTRPPLLICGPCTLADGKNAEEQSYDGALGHAEGKGHILAGSRIGGYLVVD